MALTLYKEEKLVIKTMNTITSVDNGKIYNQNHTYFYQKLILLTIYNDNKLDYLKIFL